MCVLYIQQCPNCRDKYTVLQFVKECHLYYTNKNYCQDCLTEESFEWCEDCLNNGGQNKDHS